MLCICESVYCLSNMLLLLCFIALCYIYIRGRINIFYDQNDILDSYDQGLYSICLVSCIVISVQLVYPHYYIELLDRQLMLIYQTVLMLVMMKLHEINIKKIAWTWIIVLVCVMGYALYGSLTLIQILIKRKEKDV